jgi:alpha-galactosidase
MLQCNINADVLLAEADAMVSSGMVAAGYRSFNIDDCWPMMNRAASGDIVPDPDKFPNGMANFSGELAKRGLQLGIYTAHGPKTCQGFPGSLGHEKQDAALYVPSIITSFDKTGAKVNKFAHTNDHTYATPLR